MAIRRARVAAGGSGCPNRSRCWRSVASASASASDLQQFARPGVVYRPLDGPTPYLTLGVAYRSDDTSPAIRTFGSVAAPVGELVS